MAASLDFGELLAEYERAAGPAVPHHKAPREFSRQAEVVARNGEMLPNTGKLTFAAPPPLAVEPTFDERIETTLAPFRERFQAAEELLIRKTAEVESALSFRDDLEKAAASVRNISTDPSPRQSRPSPKAMMKMSPEAWDAYKADMRGETE
jgi:hypothetical protein